MLGVSTWDDLLASNITGMVTYHSLNENYGKRMCNNPSAPLPLSVSTSLRASRKNIVCNIYYMSKVCQITGKSSQVAGGYSNRVRATQYNPTPKRRQKANIQKRKIFVPELNKSFTLNISARGLKTIQKKGAYRALKDAKIF